MSIDKKADADLNPNFTTAGNPDADALRTQLFEPPITAEQIEGALKESGAEYTSQKAGSATIFAITVGGGPAVSPK